MEKCLICNKTWESRKQLSTHLVSYHKVLTKYYYDTFFKKDGEGVCFCGNATSYRSWGYLKFCSPKCNLLNQSKSGELSRRHIGRIQSAEQVANRIKNTDQKKKEATRKQTMLERYGVSDVYSSLSDEAKNKRNSKLSSSLTGKKHSLEHHSKIISSKVKNGTLKHTAKTKRLISNKVKAWIDSLDDRSIFLSNNNSYVHGTYRGIYYRSSYELLFLKFCKKFDITVQSAENKQYAVQYFDEHGTKRFYYPDFFLPEYSLVVEIKPISRIDLNVIAKADACCNKYSYALVTEDEGLLNKKEWSSLYEHISSFKRLRT